MAKTYNDIQKAIRIVSYYYDKVGEEEALKCINEDTLPDTVKVSLALLINYAKHLV